MWRIVKETKKVQWQNIKNKKKELIWRIVCIRENTLRLEWLT